MADDEDQRAAERAAEWAAAPKTEIADPVTTPHVVAAPVETTGRHRLTPAMLASAVELADRDAFERGRAKGRAEGQEEAITEMRRVREDVMETVHALFVIFEIAGPDWETAEAWIRRRLTPL